MPIDLQCIFEILHRTFEMALVGQESTARDQSVDTFRIGTERFVEMQKSGIALVLFHQSDAFGHTETNSNEIKTDERAILPFHRPISILFWPQLIKIFGRWNLFSVKQRNSVCLPKKSIDGLYRLNDLIGVMCRISFVLE